MRRFLPYTALALYLSWGIGTAESANFLSIEGVA